jgi:thiol-disulfide isomerase/thioredoxin
VPGTRPSKNLLAAVTALALLIAACGGAAEPEVSDRPDLPPISAQEFEEHLDSIDRPIVVNVWASWCLPCRSEAPLLNEAFAEYGDRIEFIGVDVQDSQVEAKAFLDEFGLDFDHFFDRNREIPAAYSGIGTPITFFFGPNGELVNTHNGVIDERTLALNIDELLAAG